MIGLDLPIRVALMLLMAFGSGVWCCCALGRSVSMGKGCSVAVSEAPQPKSSPCSGNAHCRKSDAPAPRDETDPASGEEPSRQPCDCDKLALTVPERTVILPSTAASDQLIPPFVELPINALPVEVNLTWPVGWKPPEPPGLMHVLTLHCQFLN